MSRLLQVYIHRIRTRQYWNESLTLTNHCNAEVFGSTCVIYMCRSLASLKKFSTIIILTQLFEFSVAQNCFYMSSMLLWLQTSPIFFIRMSVNYFSFYFLVKNLDIKGLNIVIMYELFLSLSPSYNTAKDLYNHLHIRLLHWCRYMVWNRTFTICM